MWGGARGYHMLSASIARNTCGCRHKRMDEMDDKIDGGGPWLVSGWDEKVGR
jgi:hypothetical protein